MIDVEGVNYVVALCTMEMAAKTERYETITRPRNDAYANGEYAGYIHALEDLVATLELIKKHVVTRTTEPDRIEALNQQSDVVMLIRHDVDNIAYSNVVYVRNHANHASIAGYGDSLREEHVESVVNVNAWPKTTTFTLIQDEIDVIARALACSYREHRGSSSIDALLSKIDVNKIAREERDLIVQVAAKLKLTKKFFNPSAIDQARYR